MTGETYTRGFFERDPDDVARDLIGSMIVIRDGTDVVKARIVETEAYGGEDDPASHAHRGPTPRSAVMFGPAGHLYVYRSYGVHWCMNVVTGNEGTASAVLLRAAEIPSRAEQGDAQATSTMLRGPGNLTRGLGVTGADDGEDCCGEPSGRFSFQAGPVEVGSDQIGCSPRIGVSRGQLRPSRYFLKGHPALSGHRRQER
jgi:DNA-3-methyladenine glycosylase